MSKIGLLIPLSGLLLLALWVSALLTPPLIEDTGTERPNILLILADDLGVMDVCSYYHRFNQDTKSPCFYETPNIDQLASRGATFERAYAAPLCSPTRASLISGQYGARLGFNNASSMRKFKSYRNEGLSPPAGFLVNDSIRRNHASSEKALIPAASSSALMAGSQLDAGNDVISIAEYMPDHESAFIGKWHIGGGNLHGYRPSDQGFEELAYYDEGWSDYFLWRKEWYAEGNTAGEAYLTDEITAQSVRWILNRRPDEAPFFLVVSHFAVHAPFQAKPADIQHFEDKMGKGNHVHSNSVYAAMVKTLDESVGSLVAAVDEAGLTDSTMIVLMSDNGGESLKGGQVITSNKPFRGGKGSMYEGGIRVPLIVQLPDTGSSLDMISTAVDATDLYPTIAEFAGYGLAEYQKYGDGQSLMSLLSVETKDAAYDKPHFFYDPFYRRLEDGENIHSYTPKTVVIRGAFKLIQYHLGYTELYNLEMDPYEREESSLENPLELARLRELAANWEQTIPARYRTTKNPKYAADSQSAYPVFQSDYFQRVNAGG